MTIARRVSLAVGLLATLVLAPSLRGQAPGPAPILVVVNSAAPNRFGGYLAEILRAEGITSFDVADLSAVNATVLNNAKLVVLAETALSGAQASMFSTYVAGGGRLVAMRPDPALYPTLGIAAAGASGTDGYLLINQGGPGGGLNAATLPFKGPVTAYTSAGAATVATLYTTSTASTGLPAVALYGRTAAWSFDLALSTVVTRQGDPALAGLERDGIAPYRTEDLFFGRIDLDRVQLPHADIQMRLFARVVSALLADALPLPRLWYFPGTAKTVLIPTSDAHTTTASDYQTLISALEALGARATIFLPAFVPPASSVPPATLAAWRAAGHEFGLHPTFGGTPLATAYQTNQDWFANNLLMTPSRTLRHHLLEWQGWVDPVPVMQARGIGMDTSYYSWGPTMYHPTQAQQAHGYMTGSGQPMRFVDTSGTVFPVYQQVTSLVDEQLIYGPVAEGLSPAAALNVSRQLIDASEAGDHAAIVAHFHVDYYPFGEVRPWVDGTLAYAHGLGIPFLTGDRWLRFAEARNGTTMTDLVWTPATRRLTMNVRTPAGAETQGLLVPATYQGFGLTELSLGGQGVAPQPITVNGQAMYILPVPDNGGVARQVAFSYADPVTLPVMNIANGSVAEGNAGTSVGSTVVTLSPAPTGTVTVNYTVSGGTATPGVDFTPASGVLNFAPGETSKPVSISVIGDYLDEPDETVLVQLSNPFGARAGTMSATLTIVDDDQPPVASPDVYATAYQTPLSIAAPGVLGNDQSFGAPGLTAQLVSPPDNGAVTLNANGSFTYTPAAEFGGPDVFVYRAVTATGVGNTTTVTINVAQPTTTQRPRNLRVFSIDGQTVTFRWSPGAGPATTSYIFEGGVQPGETLAAFNLGPVPVLTLVAPSGSFYVRVRAIGNVATAASDEIRVHINVPVPPSAPVARQPAVTGNTVGFSWTNTFGGAAPTVTALDVTGSAVGAIPLPPTETSIFAGVPPGTYNLSFRNGNGAGASPSSNGFTITVPGACEGILAAPANPLFYTVGSTVFGLWDPPQIGTAATAYYLDVVGYGLIPIGGRSFSAAPPPASYTVAVRAANPCGLGPPTVYQTITVP